MPRPPVVPAVAGALLACALTAGTAAAQAIPSGIAGFMTMTVCTGPAGAILPGVAPTDPGCTFPRKIRPGEAPPYRLTDFSPAGSPCAARHGLVTKANVAAAIGSEQRVVSLTWHAPYAGCRPPKVLPAVLEASVENADSAYGYIMGSGSPAGLSDFDSQAMCQPAPDSSRRFTRGWVIAPAVLPDPGQPGTVVLASALRSGNPARLFGRCPGAAHRSLTAWVLDTANFTSGLNLPAVVSDHYAQADAAGLSPGAAQQMERTYWTREFGLSRWEKWGREDWSLDGTPAPALARRLFAGKTCNTPFAMPAGITARMQTGPVQTAGAWSQVLRNPLTGEQHVWYLVHCADFTNIERLPLPAAVAVPAGYDGFWRP